MKARRPTFARLVVVVFIAAFGQFPAHAETIRDIVFECPCDAEYVAGEGELTISFGIRSHRATGSGEIRLATVVNWEYEVSAPHDPPAWPSAGEIPGRSATVGQRVSVPIAEPDGGALLMVELYERIADVPGASNGRWDSHEQLVLWPVPREDASSGTLRFVDILTDTDGDGVGDVNERLAGTSPVDAADTPGSTTIDVLALYNEEVIQRHGGAALAYFHHVLAVADAILVDSGTNIRVRGVGASLVERSQESGWQIDIAVLDEQMELAGADLPLKFFVESSSFSSCRFGCATLGGARTRGYWSEGLADISTSASPSVVGTHELGHLMGLAHSARQGETGGTFLWSRGHYVVSADGRFGSGGTIMSYGSGCRVFSHADALCHGRPRGQRADRPDGADAVTSLDLVRFQVGANRPRQPDSDGDGFVDPLDALPADARDWTDTDGDGEGDNVDPDDDNDGVADAEDAYPLDPGEWADADGDGVGDNGDEDVADASLVPDAALRALVREALDKPPNAPLTESDLRSLTVLKGSDRSIRDLAGLDLATNLGELELRGGAVANLHPLSQLAALRRLTLGGHAIADLAPLSGLTQLEYLWLYSNNIGDLSPLSGLTKLEDLGVSGNAVTDLSPLSGLTRLRYLNVAYNGITDLGPLASLANLTDLRIRDNYVQDLSPLSSLTSLQVLAAGGMSIADLSPLAGLENLYALYLDSNNVADLSSLASLSNIRELLLGENNGKRNVGTTWLSA